MKVPKIQYIWIRIKASNRWPFNCPDNEVATGEKTSEQVESTLLVVALHILFILVVSPTNIELTNRLDLHVLLILIQPMPI